MFDTHCHLDVSEFAHDRAQVLAAARAAGVHSQLVPAIDLDHWQGIASLCEENHGLYPAYGLHPLYQSAHRPDHLLALATWLRTHTAVAVGEFGLDYFVADAERDVQVYVGEQIGSRNEILWAVLRSTLWPMLIALPLLVGAVWWAVRLGVQPIRRLGRVLAERQPQALSPVTLTNVPSEMAPMIDALNSLFERIGQLLESERRFTADAAHELRTPIAAIRVQAQVAMLEADDALRRHALQGTLEGCDRATRLVEQLLSLSRLEAAQTPDMGKIDLRALARQVVAELVPKAIGKQQSLEFEGSEPCTMPGNETLLAVLVRNLVDNAVRYSPPAARIRVSVRRQAGRVVLDIGPGLDAADRQRLGERFFRVAGSVESGSGLGWSIVRRIAAVHQMTIDLGRPTALGGLSVQVIYGK